MSSTTQEFLKETQQVRQWRRLRAWHLHQRGWPQVRIAEALGVTEGAVSQWFKRARDGGEQALLHRKPPGSTARLTPEQRTQLRALLDQGAPAFGFRGEVWTCPRVAQLIRRQFGVSYHRAHVFKLLRSLGLSPQKPVRRATQRDESAIETFRTEQGPELGKKIRRRRSHHRLQR